MLSLLEHISAPVTYPVTSVELHCLKSVANKSLKSKKSLLK